MTDPNLRATVLDCLLEVAPDVDAGSIDPAESLRDELDLDSMDFLAFVKALHERLGVDIPERDYAAVDTLDGVLDYVRERRRPSP